MWPRVVTILQQGEGHMDAYMEEGVTSFVALYTSSFGKSPTCPTDLPLLILRPDSVMGGGRLHHAGGWARDCSVVLMFMPEPGLTELLTPCFC